MSASSKTIYQGHTVDMMTKQILDVGNKLLRLGVYGGETSDVTMLQGSWSHSVGASAGTHDGGAAFDLTAFNSVGRVRVFRLLGVAYWERQYLKNVWPHHNHGIVAGMDDAAPLARSQVVSYYNGKNGLANNGKDDGWRPIRLPILAVYQGNTGTRVATKNTQGRTQPSYLVSVTRKIGKGTPVNVLMEVSVSGKRWAVTDRGDFIPGWKLTA